MSNEQLLLHKPNRRNRTSGVFTTASSKEVTISEEADRRSRGLLVDGRTTEGSGDGSDGNPAKSKSKSKCERESKSDSESQCKSKSKS